MREPAVYGEQRVETVVRSKAPFPVPTHPIWGTIRISQAAGKDVRSGRGTDSSSSSLILLAGEYQPGSFQHRDRLIPGHRWEVPKEVVEPVARFQVLHEYAHGDPCAGNTGVPPRMSGFLSIGSSFTVASVAEWLARHSASPW